MRLKTFYSNFWLNKSFRQASCKILMQLGQRVKSRVSQSNAHVAYLLLPQLIGLKKHDVIIKIRRLLFVFASPVTTLEVFTGVASSIGTIGFI